MDPNETSAQLSQMRAEVERLRSDLGRVENLRRRLEGARDQLRRAEEGIERRDTIIRDARKQITTLSRQLDDARRATAASRKALAEARGSRWYAMRDAVRWAKGRPWRWLLVPWRVIRPRPKIEAPAEVEPVASWEPLTPGPSRPRAPRSPASLRVAAIVGAGLTAQLNPECTLVRPTLDGWSEILEDARPHLLVVESDRYANDGGWQGLLEKDADIGALRDVVSWFRSREIPTAFWNTTDTSDLERWLPIAALFDNVFTTDPDAVARYAARGVMTMANIAALSEGVQPRIFGPGSAGRAPRACFVLTEAHTVDARMWSETRALLSSADGAGVDIYAEPGVTVPSALSKDVRELTEPLAALYRRYAVAISGPARGDSKGKIPRRVLEMLASGAAVVAVASPEVLLNLGSVVTPVTADENASDVIRRFLADDGARARIANDGLSFVLRAHTTMHRLASIASAAGLAIDPEAERRVAALLLADDADDAEQAVRSLADGSRPPDEVILGTKSRPADLESVNKTVPSLRVRVVKQDGGARAERLRELAQVSSTPWVFLPGARSGDDALEALILRAPFVEADVVARAAEGQNANTMSADVSAAPAVARRALVAERGWPEDADTLHRWAREGTKIYAIEPAPH